MKHLPILLFPLFLLACSTENNSPSKENTAVQPSISAKRTTPKEVAPLEASGVRYSCGMNKIFATDITKDSLLWEKVIYEVNYDTYMERDVQDVYIDSMGLSDSFLIIRNERGNSFSLNIKNQDLQKLP